LADHVVNYMRSPDILFVQEVQDDNGPTNDAGKLLLLFVTAAVV
jgi:hypothetical protein